MKSNELTYHFIHRLHVSYFPFSDAVNSTQRSCAGKHTRHAYDTGDVKGFQTPTSKGFRIFEHFTRGYDSSRVGKVQCSSKFDGTANCSDKSLIVRRYTSFENHSRNTLIYLHMPSMLVTALVSNERFWLKLSASWN